MVVFRLAYAYRCEMVDVAVVRLVGADDGDDVLERGVGGEAPVVDGDGRRRRVLDLAGLEVLEVLGVRAHGLLLEVADEAVRELGGDEVADEVGVEEDALRGEHEGALPPPWLHHLQEGHQVHPLVLGLLQQRADPAAALLEAAEGAQVEQHAAHHPGHPGHRLQQQRVARVPPLEEEVPGHRQRPHRPVRQLVREALRLVVLRHVDRRVRRVRVPWLCHNAKETHIMNTIKSRIHRAKKQKKKRTHQWLMSAYPKTEPLPFRAVLLHELRRLDAPVAHDGLLVLRVGRRRRRRCRRLRQLLGCAFFDVRAGAAGAGHPRGENPRGGGHDAPGARGEPGVHRLGGEQAGAQVAQQRRSGHSGAHLGD